MRRNMHCQAADAARPFECGETLPPAGPISRARGARPLTENMSTEPISVLAVCNGRLQAHVEPLRAAGCRVEAITGSVAHLLRAYPKLSAHVRSDPPEIVFVNAPGWHTSIARRLAARAGAPGVLVVRGDLWAEFGSMLSRRYADSPLRRLDVRIRRGLADGNIPSMDHIIAVSEYIRGLVIERTGVPPERVTAVHPAVDTDRFSPSDADPAELRAELGVDVPHLVCAVTNFGFHRKIEGLSQFMPALHELLRRRDDVAVALAGAGAYIDEFRDRHAEELAHERMMLLGFFTPITKLYHASDVLVHFTLLDGIPNTAAEGNACGLPVVANDFPSMLECVEDGLNGFIVPSEVDIEATVGAIERLLDDEQLRRQMGRTGRELVVSTRRPEVIGRRLVEILRPLTGA